MAPTPKRPASSSVDEQRKLKRRVPDDQRRRVETSCDRCKRRKTRCIRLQGDEEPCAACLQAQVDCEATLPRRKRIYATEEQLDARYQALDGLVRHLFPDKDVESAEAVAAIAQSLGADSTGSPLAALAQPSASPPLTIPEGRLMPGPRGGHLYIGPASSFQFANTVRVLVQKCSMDNLSAFDEPGLRRFLRAAEFVNYNTAGSLAAHVPGHPAVTAASGEDDEPPVPEPDSVQNHTLFTGWSPASIPTPRSALLRTSDDLSAILPPRQLCDALVTAFFDHVHPNYAVFHRGSFQARYEGVHTRAPDGEGDAGWACALLMVLVLGSQALEGGVTSDADSALLTSVQARYLGVVLRDGLVQLALGATLANVQTLMLLGLYQHNAGERNAAWMLLGQAARMAIALGMMRDADGAGFNTAFGPVERTERRLVWWTLRTFEQSLSFVLGRPACTELIDMTAALPDESLMDGADFPPGYLAAAGKLTDLAAQVKRFVASVSMDYDSPARMASSVATATVLLTALDTWASSLPPHLSPTHPSTPKHTRATTLLAIYASHYRSSLGRPYLLALTHARTQAPQSLPLPTLEPLADQARTAAHRVLAHLHSLADTGRLETHTWLDMFYAHHATLVVGLYHLGIPLSSSQEDEDTRVLVSGMLARAGRMRLAPTYRILCDVATQFAYIVGLGPDVPDLPLPAGEDLLESVDAAPPVAPVPSFARDDTGFADLYHFGLDAAAPWDFFNLGGDGDVGEDF